VLGSHDHTHVPLRAVILRLAGLVTAPVVVAVVASVLWLVVFVVWSAEQVVPDLEFDGASVPVAAGPPLDEHHDEDDERRQNQSADHYDDDHRRHRRRVCGDTRTPGSRTPFNSSNKWVDREQAGWGQGELHSRVKYRVKIVNLRKCNGKTYNVISFEVSICYIGTVYPTTGPRAPVKPCEFRHW